MGYRRTKTFTIASGQTTSGEVDLGERPLAQVAVETPAALTGTALTVTTADESGGTFKPLYADGDAVSLTVSASRRVAFGGAEVDALSGARYVKFVSGSSEGAERTFNLHLLYE